MTHSDERLHALDNLRAVMMWLGIVLHVSMNYTVRRMPVPWHDTQTSEGADAVVGMIHAFRMPTFFILAGFFVALLVHKRGRHAMLKNRLLRLGAPFALLWPPLYVLVGVLAMLFVHRVARGSWGMDESLMPVLAGRPKINTMHLWFIWMLLWFSVASFIFFPFVERMPQKVRQFLSQAFARLASSAWGLALLAVPLAVLGLGYPGGFLTASGSFAPPLTEWLHNGLFFGFGLALFGQRTVLLVNFQRRWGVYAVVGFVFISISGVLVRAQHENPGSIAHFEFYSGLVYNLCTWFWSIAMIGLFVRHVHRVNPWLRYLTQSSYWVYVIHLPLTIAFGALLYGTDLSILSRIVLNIVATSVLALLSYHLLVRSTALGELLTGKRHPFTGFLARH